MGTCDPGLQASSTLTVEDRHTATAVGSGDVAVLSTPAVLALAEGACVDAIEREVPPDQTSVGAYAEIDHDHPTALGQSVTADAQLIGHHGRRLEFQVTVREDDRTVARIRHRRVLVDRAGFLTSITDET